MTPAQLLEGVKSRFKPLLVREPETQQALLRKALAAYQDRAGVMKVSKLGKEDVANVPLPDDFLALIHVSDSNGGLVYADPIGNAIEIDLIGRERFPLRMYYFANIRDTNHDEYPLPADAVGLIEDYLEALINVQNTDRQRRVEISGKFDASNLPDEATLHQRVLDLEDKMAANRAIIPGATLLP
ncbi:hypothetical protein [Rosenbergiella collisarenosi]|uniref:hypothetical protein n=1 Tax=Rosenbergiella collisarenosi TaxID=1544695 RepID=UPI001F4E3FA9|nr:hypothetical protein [Rosenbergiella collisarenosi]